MTEKVSILKQITAGASQCVKCGACVPHCPTYEMNPIEGESPRGRIALMQGFAKGELAPNEMFEDHLYNCLSCRACERVCPTQVPFSDIMDKTRGLIQADSQSQAAHPPAHILKLTQSHTLQTMLARFIWLYQRSGLQKLARLTHFLGCRTLKQLDGLLPSLVKAPRWKNTYDALIPSQTPGKVQLFLGCMSNTFDRHAIQSSIQLLTTWGYEVQVPQNQTCCGALFLHAGLTQQASHNQSSNEKAFQEDIPIITVGSGCQTSLLDYAPTKTGTTPLKDKGIIDICAFIEASKNPDYISWKPLKKRILVQTPCTMRNKIKTADKTMQLLNKIPDIEIIALEQPYCCGAAGMNMLVNEETANALANRLLDNIQKIKPDIIISSNIGCSMHLHRKLLQAKLKIPITHPATLLAQQLHMKKK